LNGGVSHPSVSPELWARARRRGAKILDAVAWRAGVALLPADLEALATVPFPSDDVDVTESVRTALGLGRDELVAFARLFLEEVVFLELGVAGSALRSVSETVVADDKASRLLDAVATRAGASAPAVTLGADPAAGAAPVFKVSLASLFDLGVELLTDAMSSGSSGRLSVARDLSGGVVALPPRWGK